MRVIITLLLIMNVVTFAYADETKGKEYYDFLIKQVTEAKWEKVLCQSPSKKFQEIYDKYVENCCEVTLENEILPIHKDEYKIKSYIEVYNILSHGFDRDWPEIKNLPDKYKKYNDIQYIYVGENGYYIKSSKRCGTLLTKNQEGNIVEIASCI